MYDILRKKTKNVVCVKTRLSASLSCKPFYFESAPLYPIRKNPLISAKKYRILCQLVTKLVTNNKKGSLVCARKPLNIALLKINCKKVHFPQCEFYLVSFRFISCYHSHHFYFTVKFLFHFVSLGFISLYVNW